jgi:hypothetical protein
MMLVARHGAGAHRINTNLEGIRIELAMEASGHLASGCCRVCNNHGIQGLAVGEVLLEYITLLFRLVIEERAEAGTQPLDLFGHTATNSIEADYKQVNPNDEFPFGFQMK